MDPDVTWGSGRGCPLADLQLVHGLRCYGNITRTRNVSEYSPVLALCLVGCCVAVKAKNVVTLEVDGVMAVPGFGAEGVSHTNTQDPLYVGGVPGTSHLIHPLQLHNGTSQLVTRSTRHTVTSCDELTVVFDGVVTS